MKKEPARNDIKENFISIRLTNEEKIILDRILVELGVRNRTEFIKARVFNQKITVQKDDPSILQFIKALNEIQVQYRAIGNNYNQATKVIHSSFSEKKAFAFLHKLEQATLELIKTNKEIIQLTKKLEEKWSQR